MMERVMSRSPGEVRAAGMDDDWREDLAMIKDMLAMQVCQLLSLVRNAVLTYIRFPTWANGRLVPD